MTFSRQEEKYGEKSSPGFLTNLFAYFLSTLLCIYYKIYINQKITVSRNLVAVK
jgi:hypothetical protein